MAPSSLLLVLLVGLVVVLDGAAARRRAEQAQGLGGEARQEEEDADAELQDVSKAEAEGCEADVSGESVTMARCRATCLHQVSALSATCTSVHPCAPRKGCCTL